MQVSVDVSTDTKLTSVEISVEIWLSVDRVLTDVSADMSVKYQLTCICQLIHPPTWTIVHTIQWGRKRATKQKPHGGGMHARHFGKQTIFHKT